MKEILQSLDNEWLYFVNPGLHHDILNVLMTVISAKWPWLTIVLVLLLWAGLNARKEVIARLLWTALTIAVADVSAHYLIKPLVGRIRPCKIEGLVQAIDGCGGLYSFPSNHATNAAVACVLAYAFFGRKVGAMMGICAGAIGFSRVYLGVHYPSDILGGYIWGGTVGFLSSILCQRISQLTAGK